MSNTNADLQEFFTMFNIFNVKSVEIISELQYHPLLNNCNSATTATQQLDRKRGYQITITEDNLERIISMLKIKGFYHDEDYTIKLKEEELIMSNPILKQLHDQYKAYLYLLNDGL